MRKAQFVEMTKNQLYYTLIRNLLPRLAEVTENNIFVEKKACTLGID